MEKFGLEETPTFYMHRNKNKPYHIDYIFSKKEIEIKNIIVGIFSHWIDYSDHMPIFILSIPTNFIGSSLPKSAFTQLPKFPHAKIDADKNLSLDYPL